MNTYSVCLIYAHGKNSFLSVKGRSDWKTKRIAVGHAKTIASLKTRTGIMHELLSVEVRDEDANPVNEFRIP